MSGRVSSVRSGLAEGRRLRGSFVKLPATEVVDIAAAAVDFVVVDLEHSLLGESDALRLVRHAWALGLPALVRIHELDRGLVNRALEAGAAGIQLSSVRRAAEVHALRDACLYPPDGSRSISLAHPVASYGRRRLEEYLERVDRPLLVIQIETASDGEPLADVLRAGADVVFVGITDLTVDCGLDADRVSARVNEIAAAADEARVVLGGFGDDARFRYAIPSSDVALLAKAYADG